MNMNIKTKLTYGIGLLFVLITLLGGLAIKNIHNVSDDTQNILADNYQSLSYARQMLYSLENIGKDTAAVNVFIDNLRKQQNNITEKDEAEVTTRLMMHFEQFKKDTGQLVVRQLRQDLNDIIQVNMHSIYHKSEIAGRTATNALLWIYVVGIVCVVIALGILMVFPGSITRPIRELMDGIVEMTLSSDASWIYQGRSNVYSQINDTIYGITCDSIYPRYRLSLGKYGLPLGRYDAKDLGLKDFIMMQGVCENKECLLFKFSYNKKMWFSRYDKKTEKIDSWEQTPLKGIGWMAIESPGITNDIDGSQSFDGIRYAGKNSFYFKITPDNLDQVRRNVTEAKVKFPEKQAELLKLLDEMGEDDNPIIAFYKLKD